LLVRWAAEEDTTTSFIFCESEKWEKMKTLHLILLTVKATDDTRCRQSVQIQLVQMYDESICALTFEGIKREREGSS